MEGWLVFSATLGPPDRPNSATKHSRHHPHYWCLLGLALLRRRFDLKKIEVGINPNLAKRDSGLLLRA